jgi:hypothetical protein
MTGNFETVYTIDEYYDGPRTGVADFSGNACYYRSVYLDTSEWNPDEDRFELSPIPSEVLALALEAEEIFRRWDVVRSSTPGFSYADNEFGALPEDQARYAQLRKLLKKSFKVASAKSKTLVRGKFERAEYSPTKLMVCWIPISSTNA